MGYEIDFIPPEEVMEKFNVRPFTGIDYALRAEAVIIAQVLNNCVKDASESANMFDSIRWSLISIVEKEKRKSRKSWYDIWKNNGRLWFCGWEWSRRDEISAEEMEYQLNEQIDDTAIRLFSAATSVNVDFFDNQEKWYELSNWVKEELDSLKESASSAVDCEVFSAVKDYEEKYDEEKEDELA